MTSMLKPKPLAPGNTIGIVAPASPPKPEAFKAGLQELERLGFRLQVAGGIFERQFYTAGPAKARAQSLIRMFEDPAIDAIFCARGGYGCHHLLPYLDPALIRAHPKIFMGYSDVTVLLQLLENQCGLTCFHGPMVAFEFARGQGAYEESSLRSSLFENKSGWTVESPRLETIHGGVARGALTGGCLSLLCALLGTPFEMETRDRILFLEDIDARPYQIDRMLTHMKLAGKLEDVRGIVFGEMMDCLQGSDQDYRLQDNLAEILKEYDFPIVYGFPSGHVKEGMVTLPFGLPVELDADSRWLKIMERATA